MGQVNFSKKNNLKSELKRSYLEALNNLKFKNLINKLDINENVAMANTSKLEETLVELDHCVNCKGLFECQNRVEGSVYYPQFYNEKLRFDYVECKYQKAALKNKANKKTSSKELDKARMKDIDIDDKKRVKIIKWLKDFYDKYDPNKPGKGLFLHGSFGSGKTFMVAALLNELNINKKVNVELMYFPEILRTLKDDWSYFASKMDFYSTVDILLIDDIGAEKVTEWGRDEVLGTILQARMNDNLATFFTSNLNIEQLEKHLAISSGSEDSVKARRIIERIKQLTTDLELVSENRRK